MVRIATVLTPNERIAKTSERFLPNPQCNPLRPEGHLAYADTSEPHGPSGVEEHHRLYLDIIKELQRTYRFCDYVNHAAY